ncbi:MAG: filamentous hemagglutinin N-terminal domain-containing protein [Nitrospira sp.]|nr:filamentous hemagglutinin N-terminal domain-containing protein [Nitrospira sp.]
MSVANMSLKSRLIFVAFCVAMFHLPVGLVQAGSPITSSGLNTQINLSAAPPIGETQYDITGGTRSGTNLFHSFGNFNVPDHNIANFLNDTGLATTNILGRVTGGNVSHILGTIQTTGFENANLFLMNPTGIVFGPNASLNVGGSVAFTTANYLRLAEIDGKAGIFHADSALPSLLTSSPVAAFGFLGPNPTAIVVQGSALTTQPGQSLSLVGGNITVEAGTLANNKGQPAQPNTSPGRINLASVASPGEILVETLGYAPNIHGQSFGALGTIQVLEKSSIDASGNGGGTVLIRGGQFILDNSKIFANVTGPGSVSNGVELIGGGIDIAVSRDATIQNGAVVGINVANDASPGVTYGGVQVTADRILFLGIPGSAANYRNLVFTRLNTNTEGAGNAGNITLQAMSNIETTYVASLASTTGNNADGTPYNADGTLSPSTLAKGNAGNVELTSLHGNILMAKGGRATEVTSATYSRGNTGRVIVAAREGNIDLDGANLFTHSEGMGVVGPVNITARNLHMKAGLLATETGLQVNQSNSSVKPGGITVTLSGTLTMEADLTVPARLPKNSLIVTGAFSPTGAPAGDITFTTKDIIATQKSLISSETYSAGPGGQLKIFTDTLELRDGSQIKSGSTLAPEVLMLPHNIVPTGPGGNITIQSLKGPSTSVLIDGSGSGIFSNTVNKGAGGTIDLSARSLTIQNGGTISAETAGIDSRAVGGSIDVNATDHVTMTNGASITAGSIVDPQIPNSGIADAGNIKIDAGQQLIVQDSKITTEALQAKKGGDIKLVAIDRIHLANGEISTSVRGGHGSGGNITIDPKIVVLQNSQILAQAVRGKGGDITITTQLLMPDSVSRIDASTPFGLNGAVRIQAPYAPAGGKIQPLGNRPLQATSLFHQRCAAVAGGQFSTFTVAGRNNLPTEPGGWLSSPLALSISISHGATPHGDTMTGKGFQASHEPTEEFPSLSLRQIAPPRFLTNAFAIDRLAGCRS